MRTLRRTGGAVWSYDHSDPNERQQEIKGYLMPYSTNLDLYDPLCLRCHRQRDQ